MYRSRDPYKSKHRRRAKKYGGQGSFDRWDVEIRRVKQGNKCHYCREQLELDGPRRFQVDHFIPLSRGGTNYMNNLVIACPDCNRAKADKLPWEFRPARFDVNCKRD
ncbi:HNH endonuclease [uncultured Deinococcus sp.]|uniref:HNH endonuclease n=1 Tax=uncultured Deinococcus sp. TaxID=158789 RepID=UPI0025D8E49C|nr:HNH endonuclease [uncultured Deinococcus sp.]